LTLISTTFTSNKTKLSKFLILFTFLGFYSHIIYTQNDSIKVERLYLLGNTSKRIKPKICITSFEKAVTIINDRILSKNKKNNYFLLKKSIMLDNLSFYYRKGGELAKSLNAIQESLKIKEKIGETFTLCYTYRLLGRLYLTKKDSLKSWQFTKYAYELASTYGNHKEIVNGLNQYSKYFSVFRDHEKAEYYVNKAYNVADSIGYQRGKAFALARKSTYARKKKNYYQSIIYSNEDLEISLAEKNKIGIERSYNDLGVAYRKLKQPKQAIKFHKKSLDLVLEMELDVLLANRLLAMSNSYSDLNKIEKAFAYYRAYKRQQIKDINIKSIKEFALLDAKHTYEQQKAIDSIQLVERQKTETKHQLEKASTRFWKYTSAITGVFGLLFTIIIIVLRRKREQVKLGKLKNEMLQNEINYKQKDISDFALNISRNQKWRAQLLVHIKKLKKSNSLQSDTNFKALEKIVSDREIVDKHTVDFQNKVDILNTAFYKKLQKDFPLLTKTEIKLCSFIRLNIDNNEIATLQNVAIESVYTSRFRLRKKLNLSSNEDLNEFLNKF